MYPRAHAVFSLLIAWSLAMVIGSPSAAECAESPHMTGKDTCMLNGEGCPKPPQQLTILEIIGRLKREIAKGTAIYTADELDRLEQKLADYETIYYNLLKND